MSHYVLYPLSFDQIEQLRMMFGQQADGNVKILKIGLYPHTVNEPFKVLMEYIQYPYPIGSEPNQIISGTFETKTF